MIVFWSSFCDFSCAITRPTMSSACRSIRSCASQDLAANPYFACSA